MTEITTKALINFLPFPADFKLNLLEKYDSLPQEEKIRISDLVWNLYYDYYDTKIDENFDKGMGEAQESGKKVDNTYFQQVVQKTNQEMDDSLASAGETVDLSAARKSMEQIVQAINLNKQPKTPAPATKPN